MKDRSPSSLLRRISCFIKLTSKLMEIENGNCSDFIANFPNTSLFSKIRRSFRQGRNHDFHFGGLRSHYRRRPHHGLGGGAEKFILTRNYWGGAPTPLAPRGYGTV